VKKGDRIAVMLPNLLAFPIALLGIVARRRRPGQRQPAVHGARARAPAQRRRGADHRRLQRLDATLAEVIRPPTPA
jgi:acyl-coenzyme A synthetase/AMP-(fatty) acid ligase